jgi:hypothetical protein
VIGVGPLVIGALEATILPGLVAKLVPSTFLASPTAIGVFFLNGFIPALCARGTTV